MYSFLSDTIPSWLSQNKKSTKHSESANLNIYSDSTHFILAYVTSKHSLPTWWDKKKDAN